MSIAARNTPPEALWTCLIQDRLDALEDQTQVLRTGQGPPCRHVLELQTLGRQAEALSGFLGELKGELGQNAWEAIDAQAARVLPRALEASHEVIARARRRGTRRGILARVIGSAEAIRVLREDLLLASLRAT